MLNNAARKRELLDIINKILKTETNLDFLLILAEDNPKTLIVCLRERFDQPDK
ncbi:MAG TPA: hypothetical protein VMU29_02195 [Smithella sp.]|nr:hypothetical protein [Smithella sp.]